MLEKWPQQTQLAPECLQTDEGQPQYGYFDGIVKQLGINKFKYFNEMDRAQSFISKHFDFKQFQFVSIITPRYIIGAAMADIRYVGSGFCYVYDINKNKLLENKWLKPPSVGYQLSPSPFHGKSHIGSKQDMIAFSINEGQWNVHIRSDDIKADLTIEATQLSLPLSLCTPTGYSGWTYTQKHNALKVRGTLFVNDEPQPLHDALASYDFSAGYMRRETSWRWACINAKTPQGIIGLNLAAGVNETGANENVLWVNGERHLLSGAEFKFNRQLSNDHWQITTLDGQINLAFKPLNCRSEKLNLGLLKSNFRQYVGHFSGELIDNNGNRYLLNNQLGLTEDHFAKW